MTTDPTLDPDLAAAFGALAEKGLTVRTLQNGTLDEVRSDYDAVGRYLSEQVMPVAREETLSVPGATGDIECLLFGPEARDVPVLIYFHGGGFSVGRAEGWAGMSRRIVQDTGMAVIQVDYSLSPENKFPAAYNEAQAVLKWVHANAVDMGVNPDRIALGGDSAGGTLAITTAQTTGLPPLSGLLLIYPIYSWETDAPVWEELTAFGLPAALIGAIKGLYVGDGDPEPANTPLMGDFTGLPPVVQVAGLLDPLHHDATRVKIMLDEAGVPNSLALEPGLTHAFNRMGPLVPRIDEIMTRTAKELAGHLA